MSLAKNRYKLNTSYNFLFYSIIFECQQQHEGCLILLIHLDKALDSSSWNCIHKILSKFTIGPNFIMWICFRITRFRMIMNLSELVFKNALILGIDFPLEAYKKVICNLGEGINHSNANAGSRTCLRMTQRSTS